MSQGRKVKKMKRKGMKEGQFCTYEKFKKETSNSV